MKWLLLFLLCATSYAQPFRVGDPTFGHKRAVADGGADPLLPYLAQETFDPNPGYDLTWEATVGTVNPDQSGVGLDMDGECLQISSAGTQDRITTTFGSAVATNFACFKWRWNSLAGTTDLFHFRSGGSLRSIVRSSGAGALTLLHGSASTNVTDSIPADTTVYIWHSYFQGTGANGFATLAWSTTTTRPTSGTKYAELANGTATSTVNGASFGQVATETHLMWFDDALWDEAGYPQP